MQELIENPFASWGDTNEPLIPTATLQIYQHIAEKLSRQGVDTHINRASSASLCHKRRWYQKNGHEGEKLSPRKIVNFALGDLTEHMVKYFIAQGCVGEGKLYSEVDFGKPVGTFTIQNGYEITIFDQERLSADIGGIKVTAHVDGWGKRNSDQKWELIEVKSAADYGFESFKEEGPGSYLKQAHVNMRTCKAIERGVNETRFYYLKKNMGSIWDRLFQFNDDMFKEVQRDFILSNQDSEPDRPYDPIMETVRGKPTGKMVVGFPSSYCPYKGLCYKNIKTEFKNGKPKFYVESEEVSSL